MLLNRINTLISAKFSFHHFSYFQCVAAWEILIFLSKTSIISLTRQIWVQADWPLVKIFHKTKFSSTQNINLPLKQSLFRSVVYKRDYVHVHEFLPKIVLSYIDQIWLFFCYINTYFIRLRKTESVLHCTVCISYDTRKPGNLLVDPLKGENWVLSVTW